MIQYRPAYAADAPDLHGLLQALADHDGGGKVGSVESLLVHGFGSRPLFQAILAQRGPDIVGTVLFYPDYSTHRGQPGVFVQDIYVADDCRGLGIGRDLLVAAMQAGQSWGAAYLTLAVDPGNAFAQRFYAGQGFRPRGYDFLILDGAGLAALMTA